MSPYGEFPKAPMGWLEEKKPLARLDYTEDVREVITNPSSGAVDPLVALSLMCRPSGDGELEISGLTLDLTGFLVTFWVAGGVPERVYTLSLVGTTEAGREYQWEFGQVISAVDATTPLPPPPNPWFGTAISWP